MSASPAPLITCIYCREHKPPTREHILGRSLGGDLVEPILCEGCNTGRLSRLDQALAENSLVAFSRVSSTPEAAFAVHLGGDHFVPDSATGLILDVAVTNEMQAVALPQVHLSTDKTRLSIITQDVDALVRLDKFVTGRIDAGRLGQMHIKVGPPAAGPNARLVMHRERDGYVRAQARSDASDFLAVLRQNWAVTYRQQIATAQTFEPRTIEKPEVQVHVAIRFNDVFRAVAKIAFNTLAARTSALFALSPEFDEVREYILGDVRLPEHVEAGDVAVDSRFVVQPPPDAAPLVPTTEHAVTLAYLHPSLYGWVTLYGTHNFIVKLGDISLPDEILVHEFSALRQGNSRLDTGETFRRMRAQQAATAPKRRR